MKLNKEIDERTYRHEKNVLEAMWYYSDSKPICPFPPRGIWIEISTICNLKCKFCSHRTMKRERGKMDPALFEKIIKDIATMLNEFGDKEMTEIALTRFGEPLAHKDLAWFVETVKKYDLYAYVPTNATLIDDRRRNMLLESGVDKMNISVDTIIDERHLENIGMPIDRRMINILKLLRAKITQGLDKPIIEVSMVKFPGFEKDHDLFVRFFELVGANRTNCGDCFNLFSDQYKFDVKDKAAPCINPWYALGIYWDGRANFCLQDPEGDNTCIGNCNDSSISEIWNGTEAQRIRSAVLAKDYHAFPSCTDCNVNVYHRYQQKPFQEAFVEYAQRFVSLNSEQINEPEYSYLTHLQSIKSGPMIEKNDDQAVSVIDEVLGRINTGKERFYDIAKSVVEKSHSL